MPVQINFKICDNAQECGGIEACPVKAMFWNEGQNKIDIDNNICIDCGACEKECPVGAIRFAKDEEEFNLIAEDIKNDTRSEADLFVDRYGATPIKEEYQKDAADVASYLSVQKGPIVMELFEEDNVVCLFESIPIKDVLKGRRSISYIKVDCNDELCRRYEISQLPALVVVENNNVIGKIEGYYHVLQTKELKQKLQELVDESNK